MPRAKAYQKNIFCLESEMDDSLTADSTVKHTLEQLKNYSAVKYIYRKCATKEEFKYYLKKAALKKYSNYSIVYLSAHGEANSIYIGEHQLDLEELAEIIGSKLEGKILHFGSCETINIDDKQIQDFFKATKLLAISGYTKEVDFIEGVALELLYFSWCQEYKDMKHLKNKLLELYGGLIETTGFTMLY